MLISWAWVVLECGELNAKHLHLRNAKYKALLLGSGSDLESGSDGHIFCTRWLSRNSPSSPCFSILSIYEFAKECALMMSTFGSPSGLRPVSGVPSSSLMCWADFRPPPPAGPSPVPPPHGHRAGRQAVSRFHRPPLLSHPEWPAKEAEEEKEGEMVAGNSSYWKVN